LNDAGVIDRIFYLNFRPFNEFQIKGIVMMYATHSGFILDFIPVFARIDAGNLLKIGLLKVNCLIKRKRRRKFLIDVDLLMMDRVR